jgi:hypothetical protein
MPIGNAGNIAPYLAFVTMAFGYRLLAIGFWLLAASLQLVSLQQSFIIYNL